jgi:hypothetical protein
MSDPNVLYSPLTGQAFHAGSPEFEAGFGPQGEELVATPPGGAEPEAAPAPEAAPEEPAAEAGFGMDDDDFGDYTSDEPAAEEPAPEPEPAYDEPAAEEPAGAPDVLYSSMTGEAYPAGSPEYAEGFGPMGEELVATPPADAPAAAEEPAPTHDEPAHEEPAAAAAPADEVDFDAEFAALEAAESAGEEPMHEPAPEPEPEPAVAPGTQPNPAVELPTPGTFEAPATITLYVNREPVHTYDIDSDETLIGRRDVRADIEPDLDLTPWDEQGYVSRKHCYIYRQNKNYTIYAVSNGGVQVNSTLLELGDRHPLQDGDVIVLAGAFAFKFALPS